VTSLGLLSALPASAVLTASDQFTDTDTTLNGNTGGTGWNGVWRGNTTSTNVSPTSLAYGGAAVPTVGGSVNVLDNNSGHFRTLSAGLGTDGTTIYLSYLAQSSSGGGYAGISLFNGSDSDEVFFTGKPTGYTNFGFFRTDSPAAVTSTSPVTTLSLLIYKIEFGAGTTTGNERVSLFVNPALGTEPATASASALDVGSFIFDRIRIQAGNGDSGSVDEIRFGTTYADVVPEPSAALMAALGVFSLVLRRRRA